MKNTGIIGLTVGAIAFLMSAFCLYKMEVNKNLAFVELQSVFNEFEMTKQYKGKLETVLNARKSIADSLQLNLTAQSKMLKQVNNKNDEKVQNFLYEKEVYLEKMKQFQEDNVALKRQYDGEINKQLNQYIKEYGEKKGYRYIFGAEGSGVLMYADERNNITKEVIEYINARYKGNAK